MKAVGSGSQQELVWLLDFKLHFFFRLQLTVRLTFSPWYKELRFHEKKNCYSHKKWNLLVHSRVMIYKNRVENNTIKFFKFPLFLYCKIMKKSRVGNIKIVNFPAFSCSQNKIQKNFFTLFLYIPWCMVDILKKRFDVKKFSSNPS